MKLKERGQIWCLWWKFVEGAIFSVIWSWPMHWQEWSLFSERTNFSTMAHDALSNRLAIDFHPLFWSILFPLKCSCFGVNSEFLWNVILRSSTKSSSIQFLFEEVLPKNSCMARFKFQERAFLLANVYGIHHRLENSAYSVTNATMSSNNTKNEIIVKSLEHNNKTSPREKANAMRKKFWWCDKF